MQSNWLAKIYNDAVAANSPLVDSLNQAVNLDSPPFNIRDLFNAENNVLIRDSNAINIYIVDNWSSGRQFGFKNSYGAYNSKNPYAILDYERLGHINAAIEHEMGHCFGLGHYCIPFAINTTSTNIMATGGTYPATGCNNLGLDADDKLDCSSGIGLRNIAFDSCQVDLIIDRAPLISATLGL